MLRDSRAGENMLIEIYMKIYRRTFGIYLKYSHNKAELISHLHFCRKHYMVLLLIL